MEKTTPRDGQQAPRFWQHHREQFGRSGLSQAEYCRRNDLSIKSFGYRKRTLPAKSTAVSLIEVALPHPVCPESPPLHLRIGERYHIELERHFDSETLRRLLDVLDG